MGRRFKSSFLLSVAFHLSIYLWWALPTPPPVDSSPLLLEWQPTPSPGPQPAAKHSRQNSASQPAPAPTGKSASKETSSPASALQKALRTNYADLRQQTEDSRQNSFDDTLDGGIQLDLQKSVKQDLYLPKIWRQIRTHVSYRPEHVRERVSGDVTINIRISESGQLVRLREETATGPKDLQGWVLLCLIRALEKPFLSLPMDGPLNLELSFHFTLNNGDNDQYRKDQRRMDFIVRGSTPMHQAAAEKLYDVVADEKLKNHIEWSFYAQLENYRQPCERQKNAIACNALARLYESIGDAENARRYRKSESP